MPELSSFPACQTTTSHLTIEEVELPYSRLVNLATLLLHLNLGTLSLTLDFLHISSGKLSIMCGDIVKLGARGSYCRH